MQEQRPKPHRLIVLARFFSLASSKQQTQKPDCDLTSRPLKRNDSYFAVSLSHHSAQISSLLVHNSDLLTMGHGRCPPAGEWKHLRPPSRLLSALRRRVTRPVAGLAPQRTPIDRLRPRPYHSRDATA